MRVTDLDAWQVAQGRHAKAQPDAHGVLEGAVPVLPVPTGAAAQRHGLLAVFIPGFSQLIGQDLVGFVPGNALPFTVAALAYPLHRVAQPPGIVLVLDGGQTAHAQRAFVGGRLGVALDFDHPAVAHVDQRATGAVAHAAHRAEDRFFTLALYRRWLHGFQPARPG